MDPAAQLSQLLLAAGIPISGVSQLSAGVFVIQFSGQETEAQVSQANDILSSFEPTPEPDLQGFKLAVLQDQTLPAASLVEIVKFGFNLQDLLYTPTAMQALWGAIKASDPNLGVSALCTDNTPVPTKLESYAKTFNIPLVSS